MFLEQQIIIRMISEGSEISVDAANSALHKLHFKCNKTDKKLF